MSMAKRRKASPPNPNGKEGSPIRIPLPFEKAVEAALETPPMPPPTPKRKARVKK